jgi:N6-L-threonylcarbamoyladenine synthase
LPIGQKRKMNTESIKILAIESSCDDTAAAIWANGKVCSNVVSNQLIHEQYGGVVPELASRAHQQNIVPVVDIALKQANINLTDIDAIAFTASPGLIGSLLVGGGFAKSMALALNIPIIAVDHMEAHILAHFIDEPRPVFPFMCLTISGGHTMINILKSPYDIKTVGQTIDDAVGEAFDKAAKLLGLPYPGGPQLDKLAAKGNMYRFEFPTPIIQGFDFSFSGLKTSLLYFLKKETRANSNFIAENMPDICASFQYALCKHLFTKLTKAAHQYGIDHVGIAGGVSANSYIRKTLTAMGEKHGWQIYIPDLSYCTDNAAMIAIAGYYKYLKSDFAHQDITPSAR